MGVVFFPPFVGDVFSLTTLTPYCHLVSNYLIVGYLLTLSQFPGRPIPHPVNTLPPAAPADWDQNGALLVQLFRVEPFPKPGVRSPLSNSQKEEEEEISLRVSVSLQCWC